MLEALRSGTYRWLAAAFRRPTLSVLRTLAQPEALTPVLLALGSLSAPARSAGEYALKGFLDEVAIDPDTLAARLSREYSRLFFGPGPLPCPPYGSVYLDGGQSMGSSTFDALLRYREQGLALTEDWREPPDHVAIELEFMVWLIAQKPASASRLEAQRDFHAHHLGRWAPAFSDGLKNAAPLSLYGFLSEFLPAWLARDRNLLDALTEPVLGRVRLP